MSRELTNSAQKEKRARHKQEELLTVDISAISGGDHKGVGESKPSPARAPPKDCSQTEHGLTGKAQAEREEENEQ